jgi:hypothetical protein
MLVLLGACGNLARTGHAGRLARVEGAIRAEDFLRPERYEIQRLLRSGQACAPGRGERFATAAEMQQALLRIRADL